jgi:hypothetical protein
LRAQLLQMLYPIRSERLLMEELLEADVAKELLAQVVARARAQGLTSDEHFTVDGTLLDCWTGAKSFGGKTERPCLGRTILATRRWTFTESSGPIRPTHRRPIRCQAGTQGRGQGGQVGTAERDAALVMLEQIPGTQPVTAGGDKGYDTTDFVAECRHLRVTPHVAQKRSAERQERLEECFGWLKTIALLRKVRHRGIFKVE